MATSMAWYIRIASPVRIRRVPMANQDQAQLIRQEGTCGIWQSAQFIGDFG